MTILALLLTALLFGGMTLYAFGFAAFVLRALPEETARPLIRRAFPHFYLFVLGTSGLAALCAAFADLLGFSNAFIAFIGDANVALFVGLLGRHFAGARRDALNADQAGVGPSAGAVLASPALAEVERRGKIGIGGAVQCRHVPRAVIIAAAVREQHGGRCRAKGCAYRLVPLELVGVRGKRDREEVAVACAHAQRPVFSGEGRPGRGNRP